MAILETPFKNATEMKAACEAMAPLMQDFLDSEAISPRLRSVLELMAQGMNLAQILEISPQHLDALFIEANNYLKTGHVAEARMLFEVLVRLDPLAARSIYGLALCHELGGDIERAGKLYIQFLALDATHVDGYVRLAACLKAEGNLAEAEACFGTAANLARAGHGTEKQAAEADAAAAALRAALQ